MIPNWGWAFTAEDEMATLRERARRGSLEASISTPSQGDIRSLAAAQPQPVGEPLCADSRIVIDGG